MLRLSTIAARRIGARSDYVKGMRHASSLGKGGGGGGGAGKVVAGTVLLTAGVGGGVVGYSAVDAEFRKLVQDTVPGSEDLLDMVLGSSTIKPVVVKPIPSKLKISGPVVVTKPKEEPANLEAAQPTKPVEVKSEVSLIYFLNFLEEELALLDFC